MILSGKKVSLFIDSFVKFTDNESVSFSTTKVDENYIPIMTGVYINEYKYCFLTYDLKVYVGKGFIFQSKSFLKEALQLPHLITDIPTFLHRIVKITLSKQNADWYWIQLYGKKVLRLTYNLISTDEKDIKLIDVNWYLKQYSNFCHFLLRL